MSSAKTWRAALGVLLPLGARFAPPDDLPSSRAAVPESRSKDGSSWPKPGACGGRSFHGLSAPIRTRSAPPGTGRNDAPITRPCATSLPGRGQPDAPHHQRQQGEHHPEEKEVDAERRVVSEKKRQHAQQITLRAMPKIESIDAARQTAHWLYEGVETPHRSCGIALAETFGLPTEPYQAFRKGGITGEGPCGAIQAGMVILGQILGDPDPTGAVTPGATGGGRGLPGAMEGGALRRRPPAPTSSATT